MMSHTGANQGQVLMQGILGTPPLFIHRTDRHHVMLLNMETKLPADPRSGRSIHRWRSFLWHTHSDDELITTTCIQELGLLGGSRFFSRIIKILQESTDTNIDTSCNCQWVVTIFPLQIFILTHYKLKELHLNVGEHIPTRSPDPTLTSLMRSLLSRKWPMALQPDPQATLPVPHDAAAGPWGRRGPGDAGEGPGVDAHARHLLLQRRQVASAHDAEHVQQAERGQRLLQVSANKRVSFQSTEPEPGRRGNSRQRRQVDVIAATQGEMQQSLQLPEHREAVGHQQRAVTGHTWPTHDAREHANTSAACCHWTHVTNTWRKRTRGLQLTIILISINLLIIFPINRIIKNKN